MTTTPSPDTTSPAEPLSPPPPAGRLAALAPRATLLRVAGGALAVIGMVCYGAASIELSRRMAPQ